MTNLNELDESQFKADFMIFEGYIKFSSELLRLSLLAMGGFGALVLIKLKGEDNGQLQFFKEPSFFMVSMLFFALCSAASLFHRYYASDTMSWYISWLRAEKEHKDEKSKKKREGFYKFLKRSEISLITSQYLFGGGVLFFIIALFDLFLKLK